MAQIYAFAERVMDVPPEKVYATLIDYRGHHPRILPPAFVEYDVESGGVGAGTIFTTTISSGGRRFPFRMQVSVPEPGRVIQEKDCTSDRLTTFTIDPAGSGSRVRIESRWSSPGLMGVLERIFAPRVTRRIFAEELGNIERYAPQVSPAAEATT